MQQHGSTYFARRHPPPKVNLGVGEMGFICESFYVFSVLCLLYLCARPFICVLWSPAGKGLTSWL